MQEWDDYNAILEKTQKGDGEVTEWLNWYLGCFQRALERSENLLENVAIKSRFRQRVGNIPLSEHQRKVVNRLRPDQEVLPAGLTTASSPVLPMSAVPPPTAKLPIYSPKEFSGRIPAAAVAPVMIWFGNENYEGQGRFLARIEWSKMVMHFL